MTGDGVLFKIPLKRPTLTTLYRFAKHTYPAQPLAALNDVLYGVARDAGGAGDGLLYDFGLGGIGEHDLYSFNAGNDGATPCCGLTVVGSVLYGVAMGHGAQGGGTLYEFDPSSSEITTIYSFDGPENAPTSRLEYASGVLYGTTEQGGANSYGQIYKYELSSGQESAVYSFTRTDPAGMLPFGTLVVDGTNIYGIDYSNNQSGNSLYKVNLHTGVATLFYKFPANAIPTGRLILQGGFIWGTTATGGAHNAGSVFQIDPQSGAYTTIYSFSGGAGGGDPSTGLTYYQNAFYGTTYVGGTNGTGTVFKLTP